MEGDDEEDDENEVMLVVFFEVVFALVLPILHPNPNPIPSPSLIRLVRPLFLVRLTETIRRTPCPSTHMCRVCCCDQKRRNVVPKCNFTAQRQWQQEGQSSTRNTMARRPIE